jgi:hypothetical protein
MGCIHVYFCTGDKEIQRHYDDAMTTERNWYDPKEREREKSRARALGGFVSSLL